MQIKYSIIVPVYNAEKTLKRCLDSILKENRNDIEVLLIDDGSLDTSASICEDYASKFPVIRYYYKENGGVSSARNYALQIVNGEYILFIDSDDYVVESYFSIIDKIIDEYAFDYIVFSSYRVKGGVQKLKALSNFAARDRVSSFPQIIDAICHAYINYPWAKVFRKSLVQSNNLYFPTDTSIGEDRAFNIKYSFCIESIRVVSTPLYYACLDNSDSLSRKYDEYLEDKLLIADNSILDTMDKSPLDVKEKKQYRDAMNFSTCRVAYRKAKDLFRLKLSRSERISEIGKICDSINEKHMSYPDTRFCRLVTLPVRWRLTWVIDAMAWKLTH